MLVIGLTGGMGMGKSSAAAYFRCRGVPVFDADAYVHKLYEGPAVSVVERAFPGTTGKGRVDRTRLAAVIANEPSRLKDLEAIVHPLVVDAEIEFLREQEAKGEALAVLEIPLLFETGAEKRVDVTITMSAPEDVQRGRVLDRPGMTDEKLKALRARQLPDAERRALSDFVVENGTTLENMQAQLEDLIESLKIREGKVVETLRPSKS